MDAISSVRYRPHQAVDRLIPGGRLRDVAYGVIETPWVPAVGVLKGLADLQALNQKGHLSYLFGTAGTRMVGFFRSCCW